MGFMLNILYLVILLNIVSDRLSNSIMLIICQTCILILYTCLLIICDTCLYLKPIRMATKHPNMIALYVSFSLWKIKRIEYLTIKDPLILWNDLRERYGPWSCKSTPPQSSLWIDAPEVAKYQKCKWVQFYTWCS